MRLDISLREKLVVYYVLIGVISIFMVSFYSFYNAKEAIINRSFDQLTTVREVKAQRLEKFFNDRRRELKMMSYSKDLQYYVEQSNDISTILESMSLENFHIFSFLNEGGYYSYFSLIDSLGEPSYPFLNLDNGSINKVNSNQIQTVLDKLHNGFNKKNLIVLSDYVMMDGVATLFFASKIKRLNKHDPCFFVIGVPLSAINEIMLELNPRSGLGKSGESYLVGKDSLMRSTSRFQENSVLQTSVNTIGVREAFNGGKGTKVLKDYRDIDVLSSYRKLNIQGLEWVILAEIDFKEVMAPVFEFRNQSILISALIALVLFILVFIISKRITDPMLKLRDVALEISEGKYGHTLPIYSRDEVGELTEAFNDMSLRIREQTRELREREKRLNHFYEATKDGIILHDHGRPLLINQAMEDITGYSIDDLMQMHISEIIKIHDADAYLTHPDRQFSYESVVLRKNMDPIDVEVQENPLEYESNIISSTVIRDIRERLQAQKALNAERKKRLSSFIDGQENERQRLSRELHDGLGQSLIGIKMRLESLHFAEEDHNKQTVDVVKNFVNNTIEDVRRMSNNLMPAVLSNFGLITAISNLCKQTASNSGIEVNFDEPNRKLDISDKLMTYVFRIVQEALNNAVKHSEATKIDVILFAEEKHLRILIEDNGKGLPYDLSHSTGNGLYNMRERVNLLQGSIDFEPNTGKGLVINIRIPLNTEEK